MFEDFFEKQIEYEAIQPGIILGAVDLICRQCGAVSTHQPNGWLVPIRLPCLWRGK